MKEKEKKGKRKEAGEGRRRWSREGKRPKGNVIELRLVPGCGLFVIYSGPHAQNGLRFNSMLCCLLMDNQSFLKEKHCIFVLHWALLIMQPVLGRMLVKISKERE